jgi:hypothetical protein
MAYSAADGVTYLVTTARGEGSRSDLWAWDGRSWKLVESGPGAPPGRTCATLSWDEARDSLVLFGGTGASGEPLDEVWEFRDGEWEKVSPAGPVPTPRFLHGAAYDPVQQAVLVFGGLTQEEGKPRMLADTWEWDGEGWRQAMVVGPRGRFCTQLAWSPSAERAVLFGGWGEPTGVRHAPLADGWVWDGTGWTPLRSGEPAPGPMRAHALVTAPGGDGLMLVGGYAGGGIVDPDAYNLPSWRLELGPDDTGE